MPQGYNLIFLGAAISLFSAILILILTSYFNWLEKNRERMWAIEDRKLQRRLEVLSNRLKECEDYINQLFDVANGMLKYEMGLIQTKRVDKTQAIYVDIVQALEKTSKTKISILNLNDEELEKLSQEYFEHVIGELYNLDSFEEKIKNNKIIEDEIEKKRVSDFWQEATTMRKLLIKRIDHLLGFQD